MKLLGTDLTWRAHSSKYFCCKCCWIWRIL